MVKRLGREITSHFQPLVSFEDPLFVVVTLKGAMFFAADLIREIRLPMHIDFVRLASYGAGTKTSGTVRFLKDLEIQPKGHVLLLDEIVDSGKTLEFLTNRVRSSETKSVKIAALLSKPSRREVEVPVDFLGQEVPDRFLVGYGLDYAENYRQLPEILALSL